MRRTDYVLIAILAAMAAVGLAVAGDKEPAATRDMRAALRDAVREMLVQEAVAEYRAWRLVPVRPWL